MNLHPRFNQLGHLELVETYAFYDRPLLFACRNAADTVYLAVLVREDSDGDQWIFVPMSQQRFNAVRSGNIDLHDAFATAEDGYVFIADLPKDHASEVVVTRSDTATIADNMLPVPGERLLLSTETLPRLDADLARRATQERREYLKFKLSLPNIFTTEAPAGLLGSILSAAQALLTAIGQAILGDPTARGPIPLDIVSKTELRVVGIGPGSFQVELASADLADLFGDSDAGKAMNELVGLLDASDDADQLRLKLERLRIRVAARYLDLLEKLANIVADTEVEWASPKQGVRRVAKLTSNEISAAIQTIRFADIQPPELLIVVGRLMGANINKQTFDFSVPEGRNTIDYRGDVVERAFEALEGAVLGDRYTATIRRITKLRSMTDEVDVSYELVDLVPYQHV